MEPVRPAQRLERPPLPYFTPGHHDDTDEEDEEDESELSTGIDSEAVSQQFKSLPWPFSASGLSRGISPCASMRRGTVSPSVGEQQICMSGSSLTVWSGAHVLHGGSGGAVWSPSLGLNRVDKLRASPRTATSAGPKVPGTFTNATPTVVARPVTSMGVATTSSMTTASSHCELTPQNLDRMRRTEAVSDDFPVAAWRARAKAQEAAEVSPPAAIAVSRACGGFVAGAGGSRVSRAAALLKQQPLRTPQQRQRVATSSGPPAPTSPLARAEAVTPAEGDKSDLTKRVHGRRAGHDAAAGVTSMMDSTPLLAVPHGTHSLPDGRTERSPAKDGGGDGRDGATSEAGATAAKPLPFSAVAGRLPEASSGASRAPNERKNVRAPVRRQQSTSGRTRHQGEILVLEDCTEIVTQTTASLPPKARSPTGSASAGATTTGHTPLGSPSVTPTSVVSHASVSAGTKNSLPRESSRGMTSGRMVEAAKRIPAAVLGAQSGARLPPSSPPPLKREAGEERSEALCKASPSPSAGLTRKEKDRAVAGIDGSLAGCNARAISPRYVRQNITHMPTAPQAHPDVPTPGSEQASHGWQGAELTSVDPHGAEAGRRERIDDGAPPTPGVTPQGKSSMRRSAATSSRPPFLSSTAVGMASATSGVFRSATEASPRPSAVVQRLAMPHHPQQQVRPAVIISSIGTTKPLSSQKLSTVAAVTSPRNMCDTHLKVTQAPRPDSSRCTAVATEAAKRCSSCSMRMPSSVDCLPSLGSTQPPLSLRTTNGSCRLRWQLTASSRTSSADVSDANAHNGCAHSSDSASSASTRSLQHEACSPALRGEHNTALGSSSRLGPKGPAGCYSLGGRSGANWLSSNHAGGSSSSNSNVIVPPTAATISVPAAPSPTTAAVARARREDCTDKQQGKPSALAPVALATSSPTSVSAGGCESGGDSSVHATSRVRRAPPLGGSPGNGDRIRLAERRVSQPAGLVRAALTPSKESGVVTRAVRGRSPSLEPLGRFVGQVTFQAAGSAGIGTDATRSSVKADASGPLKTGALVPRVGSAEGMQGVWQVMHSRARMLADRRSMAVVFLGPGSEGVPSSGVQAAGSTVSPSRNRPRSYSLPAGALPNAGDIPAQPSNNSASPMKGIVRRDQEVARPLHQQRSHRPESFPGTIDDSGDESSQGGKLHGFLHGPPVVCSTNLNSNAGAAPGANTAAGTGHSPGKLVQPPSLRAVDDPGSRLAKGSGRPLERLPTSGSSPTTETATNPACLNSPNDTSMTEGHSDESPVPAVRQKTVAAIPEGDAAGSWSSTSSEERGSNTANYRQPDPHHRHSLMVRPDKVASHDRSQHRGFGVDHERASRVPTRKVPLSRRRRSTDVSLPDGEGAGVS
ncbi:hypothetical protein JKF63_07899 [Porcisia hertigi]|uniref:Uncharacterized protein n=1 Tax=Porcisia hertigi TaxID=2761500 RepID=A0A836YGK9_9TRYP|nr:hypothetical protein JKF63_07899 [Porcisia hertigi]